MVVRQTDRRKETGEEEWSGCVVLRPKRPVIQLSANRIRFTDQVLGPGCRSSAYSFPYPLEEVLPDRTSTCSSRPCSDEGGGQDVPK